MKALFPAIAFLGLLALACAASQAAPLDDAQPRDLQRLQEDLANLDGDLESLAPGNPQADELHEQAEAIREEVVYLKVKMRRHQQEAGEGTGVSFDEIRALRSAIADLREDLARAVGEKTGEIRIEPGERIQLRLDEPLSSRTARTEDRFEASVLRPVRAQGAIAIPAGARVRGFVRNAQPAKRPSKGGRLELEFDALYIGEDRLELRAEMAKVGESGERAKKGGIGAALGGVVGGILGGRKGAIAGILIGGSGAIVATKGQDVQLPAGSVIDIRLEQALVVPHP